MASSALGMTERNVRFHKYRIMERLGAKSVVDLVKFAVRNRLLAKSGAFTDRKRSVT
jgi:DNA-binding CsgD family transcriptional regulator